MALLDGSKEMQKTYFNFCSPFLVIDMTVGSATPQTVPELLLFLLLFLHFSGLCEQGSGTRNNVFLQICLPNSLLMNYAGMWSLPETTLPEVLNILAYVPENRQYEEARMSKYLVRRNNYLFCPWRLPCVQKLPNIDSIFTIQFLY